MKYDIQLRVNGELRGMAVEPNGTLLNVLLEDFRLTRTKEGCSVGECGACTVSIDGKLVNSCLGPAVDADGKAIVQDGKLVDLEPDMESGLHAEQCAVNKGRFTIPEVMGHKDRLLYPQKRVGARGEGKWQRICWDGELDTIAA